MATYLTGDLLVDTERRELSRAGQSVPIEPRVFDVLTYLILHRDRSVPKSELLDQVWNGRIVTEGVLAQAIVKGRRVFGNNADEVIKTIHRVGYRFVGKVRTTDPADAKSELKYLLGVMTLDSTESASVTEFSESSAAILAGLQMQQTTPGAAIGLHLTSGDTANEQSDRPIAITTGLARLAQAGQILVSGAAFELGPPTNERPGFGRTELARARAV